MNGIKDIMETEEFVVKDIKEIRSLFRKIKKVGGKITKVWQTEDKKARGYFIEFSVELWLERV